MAPVPTIRKKQKPTAQKPVTVETDNVYDEYGRSLTSLLQRQKRTDAKQSDNITVNRQHAQQNESNTRKNNLIYRDVFPGRKYKLYLSDTTWITGSNTVTIGYVAGDTFTQISYDQDNNEFSFEIPSVSAVDYVEVRLTGATDSVRGYLEDNTSASGLWDKVKELIQDILGLKTRIETLETQLSTIQSDISSINGDISSINGDISDLDQRVTALENA